MMRKTLLLGLLLVCWSPTAHAAIARVDTATFADVPSGGVIVVDNLTVSGSDKYIQCWVSFDATGDSGNPTAVWDAAGANESFAAAVEDGGAGQWSATMGLTAPSDGTNLSVTISGLTNGISHQAICVSYTGVDQATPIGTVDAVSNGSATTTISSGSISQDSGDWILSALSTGNDHTEMDVSGGGNTLVLSVGGGANGMDMGYAEDTDGATDTMDWTWTGTDRVSVLSMELNAAAGGGGTPRPKRLLLMGVGP